MDMVFLMKQNIFCEDGSQNYLGFQLFLKYSQCKYQGLLEESIKTSATLGNSLTPRLIVIYNRRITAKFKGNCLIQDDICFIYKNLVNLYFVYKLDTRSRYLKTNFTLGDCLFGAVQLTKNAVAHKFKCNGYDSDARLQFSLSNSE